ncbi:hypothetical protein [Glycomyces sp. NPDC048151]|uniref:hypothetical protein n=1 Tax=Glycomyces sp. NPDC048151 TaxID=3364002 RepID=UPI003710A36D
MEPLQAKPAYHRPIPWQVLAALALICGSVLSLAVQASLLLELRGVLSEPGPSLVMGLLVTTALAALASAVLAVGIAARQNWARTTEIALCVLSCFYNVPAAVGFSIAPVRTSLGYDSAAALSAYLALALCLALLFLLHSEKAAAYTYRGGGSSWPEE